MMMSRIDETKRNDRLHYGMTTFHEAEHLLHKPKAFDTRCTHLYVFHTRHIWRVGVLE